jgi:flagellar hook-length control protein FliK
MPSPEHGAELGEYLQLLKEQFPTLNVEKLSAQVHLASPELVKPEAPLGTPNKILTFAASTSNSVTPSPLGTVVTVQPKGQPISSVVPEPINAVVAQESAGVNLYQSATYTTDPVVSAAAPAPMSKSQFDNGGVKSSSDQISTRDAVVQVEKGNLEKTAVKATESASDPSQTAQQWSSPASDGNDMPVTEKASIAQPTQFEKTKFKIQFDRFQIETLLQRSEIKLQLHPASLGSMRVKLVSTPQEMTARFETTTEAARTVVEQNLPQLRESLERAGIKVDHVEVVLAEQRTRQQQAQYQSNRKQRHETEVPDADAGEPLPAIGSVNTAGALVPGGLSLLA